MRKVNVFKRVSPGKTLTGISGRIELTISVKKGTGDFNLCDLTDRVVY